MIEKILMVWLLVVVVALIIVILLFLISILSGSGQDYQACVSYYRTVAPQDVIQKCGNKPT